MSTLHVASIFLATLLPTSLSQASETPSLDTQAARPSSAPGMGAVPFSKGTTFRVWAPNAKRASVQIWDQRGHWQTFTLAREKDCGNFSTDVLGATPGLEYRYVLEGPKGTLTRPDPRSAQVKNSGGNSVIVDHRTFHWRNRNFRPLPKNEQVIYELHIGSFAAKGDGKSGTWNLARARLSELARLGINMIEVLPPAEFAGDFSWGYNPAYPFAPESAYGTPDDMKAFIDAAHSLGIGVIVDLVHNHWGPGDLDMWAFDGETYGSGGIYFYTDWRRETPWGPRPDYGRLEVRDFIVDNAKMWIDVYHADGLRWDSTNNIHSINGQPNPEGWGILQRVNEEVARYWPEKASIGEDLRGDPMITRSVSQGGAGFTSQWDNAFTYSLRSAIIPLRDADRNLGAVRDAILFGFDGDSTRRVIFTESHDEVANGKSRIPEMIWPGNASSLPSRKRSTLAAAIAFTSPGVPMLFQGQECLQDGDFKDSQPLDWSKCQRFSDVRRFYSDLIRLRRNGGGKTRGLLGNNVNVFHLNDTDKVLAYHRFDRGGAGDDVIVIANFSEHAHPAYVVGLPRGGTWKTRLNSDSKTYSADYADTPSSTIVARAEARDGLGYQGTVAIGPYSIVILSQD